MDRETLEKIEAVQRRYPRGISCEKCWHFSKCGYVARVEDRPRRHGCPDFIPALFKTKWYIVSLDTRLIDTSRYFDSFWKAVDTAKAAGREGRYTALRGGHIMEHTDTWMIGGSTNG
jgi:hypothetical protein